MCLFLYIFSSGLTGPTYWSLSLSPGFFKRWKLNHTVYLTNVLTCFFHLMDHEQCMSAAIPYWVLSVFLVFFQSDGQKIAPRCFRLQFSDQASFYVFWRFAFSPLWNASSNPNPLFYWAFSIFLVKLYSTLCIGKTFTFCLLHVLQIFFFHSVLCLLTSFMVSFVIQKF